MWATWGLLVKVQEQGQERRMDELSTVPHTCQRRVFSSMTSFTRCFKTSFTLHRERSERWSVDGNALEDDGRSRAAGEVCGCSQLGDQAVSSVVRGVRS